MAHGDNPGDLLAVLGSMIAKKEPAWFAEPRVWDAALDLVEVLIAQVRRSVYYSTEAQIANAVGDFGAQTRQALSDFDGLEQLYRRRARRADQRWPRLT